MIKKDAWLVMMQEELNKLNTKAKPDEISKCLEYYINEGILMEIRTKRELYIEYTTLGKNLRDNGFFRKKENTNST